MKNRKYLLASLLIPLIALSSCASYKAASLNTLSSEIMLYNTSEEQVVIVAKAFNKADCKKYLDRDVISKGYQPVQIYIQNNSDKNYHFSLDRINLACARPDEVADKVHTSTAGRVAGYTTAAVLSFGILVIPAVIDGVKSSQANDSLDNDFSAKTARDQIIYQHSHFNKLVFIPVNEYQQRFSITLLDEANKPKTFNVMAS